MPASPRALAATVGLELDKVAVGSSTEKKAAVVTAWLSLPSRRPTPLPEPFLHRRRREGHHRGEPRLTDGQIRRSRFSLVVGTGSAPRRLATGVMDVELRLVANVGSGLLASCRRRIQPYCRIRDATPRWRRGGREKGGDSTGGSSSNSSSEEDERDVAAHRMSDMNQCACHRKVRTLMRCPSSVPSIR
ncbi:Os09g0385900 [Oryza sativa Japonica Group]|jgi:hypothetical protein|uniref:Os09g0385900 protein n=2 Tax=Oryza sativa subsp. japonica TaxID=39947 RepID=Q0J218_ORYSJ|nr:uncharacterized protein LOC4346947 [Oryza sativa Japonica Group]BAD26105.1 unknown protein [Oryza sativa Japonica Group]BAF24986.1 Os09g0385900 [Oryza sativa Japonica Group]BAT07883.1 Os09g0385900 [Oryza sativa Japonica Group]|eukprot:NP_001063072.1 Os09g0385900 [Oryza sativa Japonica Group]